MASVASSAIENHQPGHGEISSMAIWQAIILGVSASSGCGNNERKLMS